MAVGLSSSQRTYLGMINQVRVNRIHWSYLDPSWIMTHMAIESGYQPLVWNGAGRQDGLMQVIPPTASDMATKYGIPAGPQTEPMISIMSGMAYLDTSARAIIAHRATNSLPLWDLVQAYNEGFGAVEAGRLDLAYLRKFQAQLPIIQAQMAATVLMATRAPVATTSAMVAVCCWSQARDL